MADAEDPRRAVAADARVHWEQVYRSRQATEVSWYRAHLERSLALITQAAPERDAGILDVGGGASTLVDDLLALDYRRVAVLDLSAAALQAAQLRLGAHAGRVTWLYADMRSAALAPQSIDVWHDRAVFHFLTGADDRAAYLRQAVHALKPRGNLVIATFAPDGPERCSGLPVVRQDAASLADFFGADFQLRAQAADLHKTPAGNIQSFTYCHFQRHD